MDTFHSMTDLFVQMGLPSESHEIEQFIAKYRPVSAEIHLYDAPFWNDAQKAFLHENIMADADWAPVIDELNVALRQAPPQ